MTIDDDEGRFKVQIRTKDADHEKEIDLFEAHESLLAAEGNLANQPKEVWHAVVKEWAEKLIEMPDLSSRTAFSIRQTVIERVKAVGKVVSGSPV